MKKILVIEDEKHIAEGIKFNLTKQGYEIELCFNGIDAVNNWKKINPDMIILDLMLPELDGFKVLEHIRLYNEKIPILILSARDAVEDKIRCFKKGVDDYMSKPFDLDEFLLRIERNLQRSQWHKQEDEVELDFENTKLGRFNIDFDKQLAVSENESIELTMQELRLLKVFFQNPDKMLSRKFLLENAFGYSANANSRTVDNFIVRFRKYFEENPKKPVHFKSKRAMGYQFNF